MNKIFIVDLHKNPGLLRLTEVKLFFDAKNQGVNWACDCEIVDSIEQITSSDGIIINSGEIVTTNFREKFPIVDALIDCRGHEDLIQFTPEYDYNIRNRPPFKHGSKQLYVLENLYKVILRSKKLVYIENTEPYQPSSIAADHFYGLASGWKSIQLVRDIGLTSLKSITVFDLCERQLQYQKYLHSCPTLPESISMDPPICGEYDPPTNLKEFWPKWHETDVNFKILDLLQTPIFPENSFVWISNVFKYEPTIFEMGWQACKSAKKSLFNRNNSCIIIES
jgi:hypothetical protein